METSPGSPAVLPFPPSTPLPQYHPVTLSPRPLPLPPYPFPRQKFPPPSSAHRPAYSSTPSSSDILNSAIGKVVQPPFFLWC